MSHFQDCFPRKRAQKHQKAPEKPHQHTGIRQCGPAVRLLGFERTIEQSRASMRQGPASTHRNELHITLVSARQIRLHGPRSTRTGLLHSQVLPGAVHARK